ncbi:TatD family deoxyribonuclease [Prolixibacteraceae bacterium JC049]|nr:TatD family deoxyribonuclease [Prolixibacteraceae bacterium JC049]
MLIDTHSHIFSKEFSSDVHEVVERAISSGVEKIVLPNVDSSSIKNMLDLSDAYPDVCYPVIGLHPTSVKEDYEEELEIVNYWLKKRSFKGIGEIGIDLYWDSSFLEEQIIVFRQQLRWAKERKLPVVIHVRDSFEETFQVIEEEMDEDLKGVFHSFTGTEEQAHKITGWGFKLGINGIVTFKNGGLDKTLAGVDMKHLMLETDSPYLAPVPFRGKRNESAYIRNIQQKIADIYNVSLDEVARVTTDNARKLFNF